MNRTPFRLFRSVVEMPRSQLSLLPNVLARIEQELTKCEVVESQQRDVLVAASGFRRDNILITVEVNLRTNDSERGLFEGRNRVVQVIADCLPGTSVNEDEVDV